MLLKKETKHWNRGHLLIFKYTGRPMILARFIFSCRQLSDGEVVGLRCGLPVGLAGARGEHADALARRHGASTTQVTPTLYIK